MQEGEVTTPIELKRERQRLVDARQTGIRAQRLRLDLCKQTLKKRDAGPCALIGVGRQRLSKFGCASRGVAEPTVGPTGVHFRRDGPKGHPVLPAEGSQHLRRAQCRCSVASHCCNIWFSVEWVSHRWRVIKLSRTPDRHFNQFARAFGGPQLPARHGEARHRHSAGVLAGNLQRFPAALQVTGFEHSFAMGSRVHEFAGSVAGQGQVALSDAGFRSALRAFSFS
jgi:hypothetical protein